MNVQNFLESFIYPATSCVDYSFVSFDEDNEKMYCPFCGKEFEINNSLDVKCDCKLFNEEKQDVKEITKIRNEIKNLLEKESEISKRIRDRLDNEGVNGAAKAYLDLYKTISDNVKQVSNFLKKSN